MATPIGGIDDASSDLTFPTADAEAELHPGQNVNVEVDPISSQVATSLEIKEQLDAAERKEKQKEKEKEKREAFQSLKKTIIVSGIIVAVAGAVFAITKKMKEK